MAELTITDRRKKQWGSLSRVTGYFTDNGSGGNYEINTGLGRLFFFRLRGITDGDVAGAGFINSATNAASETKGGVVHINTGLTSGASYQFVAYGEG